MYIIFRYKFTGFFYKLRTFRNIPNNPKKMYIIFRYKFTGFFYKLRTFRNIPNSSNYEILALRGC